MDREMTDAQVVDELYAKLRKQWEASNEYEPGNYVFGHYRMVAITLLREIQQLRQSDVIARRLLQRGVDLVEMDAEANTVGTDLWVWLEHSRAFLHPPVEAAAVSKREETAESIAEQLPKLFQPAQPEAQYETGYSFFPSTRKKWYW